MDGYTDYLPTLPNLDSDCSKVRRNVGGRRGGSASSGALALERHSPYPSFLVSRPGVYRDSRARRRTCILHSAAHNGGGELPFSSPATSVRMFQVLFPAIYKQHIGLMKGLHAPSLFLSSPAASTCLIPRFRTQAEDRRILDRLNARHTSGEAAITGKRDFYSSRGCSQVPPSCARHRIPPDTWHP